MNRIASTAFALCAVMLSACGETAVQEIAGPAPSARIKFFNFGVNAPSVNFYANDTKITGVLSTSGTEATTGVAYGGVGSGGVYSGLEPGQYTFTGRITATIDKDLPISTVPLTLADGKYYSLYQSGFYNTTTKTIDAFVVEDPIPATIDYATAQVRFVNAISNSAPMTLYAKSTSDPLLPEIAIAGPVSYKGAGQFTVVPPGIYDLNTRNTGSSANAITRTGVTFAAGRMYTIAALGDMTVGGTTATNRARLDNVLNR